ncbi:MAG: glycosyltransferase family 2 protein [Streptosporangiaceae bacterium]
MTTYRQVGDPQGAGGAPGDIEHDRERHAATSESGVLPFPTPVRGRRDGRRPPWALDADGGIHRQGHTVTVVLPALNEARNVGSVLDRIPSYVDEVVIVDGDSTDGTVDVARSHRPDVVVTREPRRGKGLALRAGFRAASGDVIVMLDADGSMAPEEIGRFLFLLAEGYQLVKGSRFLIGGGSSDITWMRRVGNHGLRLIVNTQYQTAMTDLCYGYCAFFTRDVRSLELTSDGFEIEAEIVTRALAKGLRVTEVPSFEKARLSGRSNLRPFRDGGRILRVLATDARPWSRRRPSSSAPTPKVGEPA